VLRVGFVLRSTEIQPVCFRFVLTEINNGRVFLSCVCVCVCVRCPHCQFPREMPFEDEKASPGENAEVMSSYDNL
jgi:hypothetical protein